MDCTPVEGSKSNCFRINEKILSSLEHKGKVVITANPPRPSSPVQFQFGMVDVVYAGITLISSMPDDMSLNFAKRKGLTVALVSRQKGSVARIVTSTSPE
jgi:hypothetical protein